MPDWSYQTVFRRVLFCFPPEQARSIALFGIGTLGRLPFGQHVINYMGHMVPSAKLRFTSGLLDFPSRVGLSCGIDPNLEAFEAFGQFGFGYIEIGPVAPDCLPPGAVERDSKSQSITLRNAESTLSLETAVKKLTVLEEASEGRVSPVRPLRLVRLAASCNSAQSVEIIRRLRNRADAVILPESAETRDSILNQFENADDGLRQVLFFEALSAQTDKAELLDRIHGQSVIGVVINGSVEISKRTMSPLALDKALELTQQVRDAASPELIVIASGGVHEPGDALRLQKAGANLIGVDSGFIFTGPGLPKRINEAMLNSMPQSYANPKDLSEAKREASRQSWFWAMLMGIAMLAGGCMAVAMALTRVVLPYDEQFLGITSAELLSINDRLIDFMKHDRLTLAGTMLSLGMLYTSLAWYGIRDGRHWAQQAVVCSAFVGFLTFFFFLGFGYFDPFHAFVTTILFQFLLLTIYAKLPRSGPQRTLDLWNDRKWKLSQWGQSIYIFHGAVLIVAGCVISKVGMTNVFVPEDMEFLCTTADNLLNANPQLVPLVAHDRATFGGMLISVGIVVHLVSLWGFRRGARWLWWTLLIAGMVPYIATIWVHANVGYTSLKHLLPAYGGLIGLIVGACLSHGYLCDKNGHALNKRP